MLLLHLLHSRKEKMECNRKNKLAPYRCEQDSVCGGGGRDNWTAVQTVSDYKRHKTAQRRQ